MNYRSAPRQGPLAGADRSRRSMLWSGHLGITSPPEITTAPRTTVRPRIRTTLLGIRAGPVPAQYDRAAFIEPYDVKRVLPVSLPIAVTAELDLLDMAVVSQHR
jgi:hypothetical protein